MKSMIIVGMGPGMSTGMAERFGREGFKIGMISRSAEKLAGYQSRLAGMGIESHYAPADVADTDALLQAVQILKEKLGGLDVLNYNAVDYRMVPLMEESVETLTRGFKISVANAFAVVKAFYADLKAAKSAVLITGGGTANYPNPQMASISLGKAGIRNLAFQLHQIAKADEIYVGTLTVSGWIHHESTTHSPAILAEKFWQMYKSRHPVEVVH